MLSGAQMFAQNGSTRTSVNKNTNVNANKNTNVNVNNNYNANVNKNVNVNTNQNVNVNVNKNVNVNTNQNVYVHGGCCYNSAPVGVAVVGTTTTAVVVGTRVTVLPASCTVVRINGFTYSHCGSVWYQPQFVGTTTSYVVVTAPR